MAWWILAKEVNRTNKLPLKLRVVRSFTRGVDRRTSQEIIFHDEEGGRISGVVKTRDMQQFDGRFIEGNIYGIRNYFVEQNTTKSTLSKFRIVVHNGTIILERPNKDFPSYMFAFRSFQTLVDENKVDATEIFDIIGRITEIHSHKEFINKRTGRDSKRIDVIIEDNTGARLRCTLFDEFVDRIQDFEAALTAKSSRVAIFQMFKANIFNHKVGICNEFDGSNIIFDESIPEIVEFIKTLPKWSVEGAGSFSKGSVTHSRSENEDLESGIALCNPIDSLYTVEENCIFWICATINSIIDRWWFLGCKKCERKLEPKEDHYHCNGCKVDCEGGVYRYRLRLEVHDKSANTSIMCWDKEAEMLVGKICHALRIDIMEKNMPADELPHEMLRLIDQTAMFKVKVKSDQIHKETSVFSVVRLVTDIDIVSKYNKITVENDEDEFLKFIKRAEESNIEEYGSEDEVNTPLKKTKEVIPIEDGYTKRQLDFDEGIGSSTSRKTRSLTKEGKPVRRTARIDEDDSEGGET